MKALLLFHVRVGIRVAVRSFTPLFAAILVVIILQTYPVEFVRGIAARLFAARPETAHSLMVIALAFLLPLSSVPDLAMGWHGWMRHLPVSRMGNRRGMMIALGMVQLPLAASFVLLAIVGRGEGLAVGLPLLRWSVVLTAGACAAAPVCRQALTVPLCLGAAFLSTSTDEWLILPALAGIVAADAVAGTMREPGRRKPWRAAGSFLNFRISWRALGFAPCTCTVMAAIPLGGAALFISNNELVGEFAGGAARFGGALSGLLLISGLARRLAVRRPPWPLARSFPWSAAHRVMVDALFLALHTLPLLLLILLLRLPAIAGTVALVPYLSLRAAGNMRQMPTRRTGAGGFIAEGIFIAGSCALLSWAALLWLAAAPVAFYFARKADLQQKVTRWLELHYATVGDSLSWSDG